MSTATDPQVRLHQTTVVLNLFSKSVFADSLVCKKKELFSDQDLTKCLRVFS